MKIRGQRVVLTLPQVKKSVIEVDERLQKELLEKEMKKWSALEVKGIGDEVIGIQSGDKVYVNPMYLHNSERIEIEGVEHLIVRASDISIVW